MAYTLKKKIANKSNYGSKRSTGNIMYIIFHYTGNDGDTDENNGKYFAERIVKASAHYFVDSDSVTQSVPDDYVAYSVGGSRYSNYKQTGGAKYYKKATNSNSLNIELCDDVKNGVVYPSAATIENALALAKAKMKQYNIPADRVIRHFDVTGKSCPAYWTSDSKWKSEFWSKLDGAVAGSTGSSSSGSSGSSGSSTAKKDNWVVRLQTECNKQGYSKQKVDGIPGKNTLAGCPTLGKSSKGNITKLLQERLNALGYNCGKADGINGTKTQKAIKAFQKAKGLTVDGIVGQNTWRKLLGL